VATAQSEHHDTPDSADACWRPWVKTTRWDAVHPIFRTPDLQVDQFSLWRLGQIMFEIKYYQLGVVDWID